MKIEDVKFDDAVFQIPKNAVSIVMNVKIFQGNEIHELKAEYNTEDIREAFNLFEKTVDGEYPLWRLTEDWARKIMENPNELDIENGDD